MLLAQKIKSDLIQKAKVKKAYAKIKAQEEAKQAVTNDTPVSDHVTEDVPEPASLELHPDRKAMVEADEMRESQQEPLPGRNRGDRDRTTNRHRVAKHSRYQKELELGAQRKAQEEARHLAREARERERRAMGKAKKPGKDGKAKLGKQGGVLLSRIQRMAEEGKL
jgi:hypothetical protein